MFKMLRKSNLFNQVGIHFSSDLSVMILNINLSHKLYYQEVYFVLLALALLLHAGLWSGTSVGLPDQSDH